MSTTWQVVAWLVMLGLPSAVVAGAVLWPEPRAPHPRSVEAIRDRVERENRERGRR